MTSIKVGDWVRYAEDFCRTTSTTSMGMADMVTRRGEVVLVFGDGKLCNIDWGDQILQFNVDSPSIKMVAPPYTSNPDDNEVPAFAP